MPLSSRIRRLLIIVASVLAVFAVAIFATAAFVYSLSLSLPEIGDIKPSDAVSQNTIVYAADGSVLAEWHGDEDRKFVGSAEIPEALKQAVVAIEDKRFYQHSGVDVQAIARAAKANADAGTVQQGGSTITQQLVKLVFTTRERTLTRKIKEAMLASELENHADKDEVLAWYLNTVYLGNGAYGVESASQRYFGVSASRLTLPQSALLAGVIRSPSAYDPVAHPDAAVERRDLVLRQMREQGYITSAQETEASRTELVLARRDDVAEVAPYFVEYVKNELLEQFPAARVYGGGLRVQTTLEPGRQQAAERAAKLLSKEGDPEVAIVSLDHGEGSVVAMVGGRDFGANQFNLATQGKRQAGSAFKPFVLVAALERGVKPEQLFSTAPYSVPVKGGVWRVQNYENSRPQWPRPMGRLPTVASGSRPRAFCVSPMRTAALSTSRTPLARRCLRSRWPMRRGRFFTASSSGAPGRRHVSTRGPPARRVRLSPTAMRGSSAGRTGSRRRYGWAIRRRRSR